MMSKVSVNGPGTCFTMAEDIIIIFPHDFFLDTHPVYRFLKSASDHEQIDWNFAKYLVDQEGNVRHFKSSMDPDDLVPIINTLLNS
jgi:glutathione peroxidase-family protein